MKKGALLLSLLILLPFAAYGVLKERDLQTTLKVLRVELQKAYEDQQVLMTRLEATTAAQHKELVSIMERSSQISLMLYSQKQNYTFDLTFACGQATELYREFNEKRMPYDRILNRIDTEIKRYEGLIATLKGLPPAMKQDSQTVIQVIDSLLPIDSLATALPEPPQNETAKGGSALGKILPAVQPPAVPQKAGKGKDKGDDTPRHPLQLNEQGIQDRAECVHFAETLLENMQQMRAKVEQDNEHYKEISKSLKDLYDYASTRYREIQQNIFKNGEQSYFATLADLPHAILRARQDMNDKYSDEGYREAHSEWRGPVVYGFGLFILFYLFVATVLSNLIVRPLLRFVPALKDSRVSERKGAIIVSAGVLIFALSIMLAQHFMYHDFLVMATGLLVEFAWMLLAICISLLIRLDGTQMKSGYRIYMPIILMGLIIITFRIIFIPNYLVTLLFPPILLAFTLWQWAVIRKHNDNIPRSDIFYTWVSLLVMAISCVLAWAGYVLFSVQVLIWWLFQLTAIQTITCIYDLLGMYYNSSVKRRTKAYRARHKALYVAQRGQIVTVTWWSDFLRQVIVPVASVFSVLYCFYLASDVFDLSETCMKVFFHPFLNVPGVISVSLFKLVVVAAAFFVFNYLNRIIKALYRHFRLKNAIRKNGGKLVRTNEINLTLVFNLTSILVWGIYAIAATVLLNIPKSGISIITAGLATGIGFAMKDLLNNFFYGVSLMAGRIRVGDYIECDGVQGKVESITYQSTQIITLDGAVMAILNSSLFGKNFKNLTRNHGYELVKIPVGVAYGTDISTVRNALTEELQKLQRKDRFGHTVIDEEKGFSVLLADFGESSVDLIVAYWVLVGEKIAFTYKAKEVIYDTLNRNHIVIPFPQRDVHVVKD